MDYLLYVSLYAIADCMRIVEKAQAAACMQKCATGSS